MQTKSSIASQDYNHPKRNTIVIYSKVHIAAVKYTRNDPNARDAQLPFAQRRFDLIYTRLSVAAAQGTPTGLLESGLTVAPPNLTTLETRVIDRHQKLSI